MQMHNETASRSMLMLEFADMAGRTPLIVTVGTTGLPASTNGVTGEVYKQLLQDELIPACRKLMRKGGKMANEGLT